MCGYDRPKLGIAAAGTPCAPGGAPHKPPWHCPADRGLSDFTGRDAETLTA